MVKIKQIVKIAMLGRMVLFKVTLASFLVPFSFLLMGCSSRSSQDATPALFDTKAEAEKAASRFNCKGAHQMGSKWMPCETHNVHQEKKTGSGHGYHQHHHHN